MLKKLFLSVYLFCLSFSSLHANWEPPPAPVYVTKAERKDLPIYFTTVGTLKAFHTVNVRAQAEGYLLHSHVSSGQEVKKGDLLFTLDASRYEALLEEALAALEREQQALEFTEAQYARSLQLHQSQAISEVELKVMSEKIDMAKGLVRMAEARVKASRLPVEHCKVYAPIDGRLDTIRFDEGSYIGMHEALVTIDTLHTLSLVFSLPERRFQELRSQLSDETLPCTLWLPNAPEKLFQAKVYFYANSIDAGTGSVSLKAEVPNTTYALWPGQFVKVRLLLHTLENATVLPSICVKRNEEGPYVFVVDEENTAQLRPLVLGPEIGEEVVILEGINEEEVVISEGQLNVWPWTKVSIKNPEALAPEETE